MNLFILQNEKRWLAVSVRLPQEEVLRVKWCGRTARSDWGGERKGCCLLASGDSYSLLHWCNEIWIRLSACPNSAPLYPLHRFNAGWKRVLLCLFSPCYSGDCSVAGVQAALTGTRPMFADQRTAGRSVGQTANPVSGEKLVGTRHLQHYLHFQPFLMQATC